MPKADHSFPSTTKIMNESCPYAFITCTRCNFTCVCVTKWRSPHVNWRICAYINTNPININRNCCHDLYIITIYGWFQSSQVNKLPVLSYFFDMWFPELTFSLYCSLQGLGWSRDEIFVYTATLLTLSCRCKPHAMCFSTDCLPYNGL